jgi:hypothetical protein
MRKIAAGLWPGFVDHAEVTVEEDALFPRIQQDSQGWRVGIGKRYKGG